MPFDNIQCDYCGRVTRHERIFAADLCVAVERQKKRGNAAMFGARIVSAFRKFNPILGPFIKLAEYLDGSECYQCVHCNSIVIISRNGSREYLNDNE